jgi:hypothetical protein
MIVGLPGFGLSALFYAVLLLGIGAKEVWGWVLRAGQKIRVRDWPLPHGVGKLSWRGRSG